VDADATLDGAQPDDVLDILALLNDLSRAQRASLVLHDYAGYPAREVARIIGSTEQAVRVQLMRARRRMRSRLSASDERP